MSLAIALLRLTGVLLIYVSSTSLSWAAIDTYEFSSDQQRERFQVLTEELRCPKCQNQNIADSNAPIAVDLRRKIYTMLQAGESDKTIIDFMQSRYGDFVLYNPPWDRRTWLLWSLPFILLMVGLFVLGRLLWRRHSQPQPQALSEAEKAALNAILKESEKS
ncbi:cytochrome c-type biogenesis protein CcmH [Zooshikella marina]|uniref:cytochrome c-type biogenesis protein n=1 Tax=Zooshikella ganghwensis TaxID=202772 RepID=UPI001BB01463|nr:cytochrome c-type biogenesis protein [Zooshikella ganghwensis]MBU2707087.1 cytochrome c-type biogenesis protein CcmH [Zooshikella ganghwensis]